MTENNTDDVKNSDDKMSISALIVPREKFLKTSVSDSFMSSSNLSDTFVSGFSGNSINRDREGSITSPDINDNSGMDDSFMSARSNEEDEVDNEGEEEIPENNDSEGHTKAISSLNETTSNRAIPVDENSRNTKTQEIDSLLKKKGNSKVEDEDDQYSEMDPLFKGVQGMNGNNGNYQLQQERDKDSEAILNRDTFEIQDSCCACCCLQ